MQLQLQARHDAEVGTGAAESPEQLRLVLDICSHRAPVGGHELDCAKAVDRQAEPALQPSDAAAERQPGDARVTDDPDRADEAVLLGRDVECAEECSATGPRQPRASGRRSPRSSARGR